MTFNEATLRAEIVKVWGGFGAHVEVYDELLRRARCQQPETEDQLEIKRHHRDFASVSQYAESAEAALMLGNTHMAHTFIQAIRNTVG